MAKPPFSRGVRWVLGVMVIGLVGVVGRPAIHLVSTIWRDEPPGRFVVPAGHADDISRLNLTPVAEVWRIPEIGRAHV